MAYTRQQIIAIGGSEWTHPGTGEIRIYINDWPALIGLDVNRYGTGNISSATLDGERISNARARDILGTVTRVWWSDADSKIHIRHYTTGRYADQVPGWIHDGIATAVKASEPQPSDDEEPPAGSPATGIVAQLRSAGSTVRQIAEMVGVSISTIYRWARGICRPRPANLATLTALA